MKITKHKNIKCATGSAKKMELAFKSKLEEMEENPSSINMSEDILGIDDVMLEDESLEDSDYVDINLDDEMYFNNYEEFIDYVNPTWENPLPEEVISEDIENLQIAIDQVTPEDESILISECPIYWNDEYEYPKISINGDIYFIHYIDETDEDGNEDRHIELVKDDVDLQDELGIVDGVVEEGCNIKGSYNPGCYELHDTYGAPQAGEEVIKFDKYWELEEYLDSHPDVMERIEEGYASIKEC